MPAVSAARCVNLLELANRLCLPRLVNLVERRVIEDLERLQPSEAIEQCLRLLEPVKVGTILFSINLILIKNYLMYALITFSKKYMQGLEC